MWAAVIPTFLRSNIYSQQKYIWETVESEREQEEAGENERDGEKNEAVEEKLAFPSLLILHGENMNMYSNSFGCIRKHHHQLSFAFFVSLFLSLS